MADKRQWPHEDGDVTKWWHVDSSDVRDHIPMETDHLEPDSQNQNERQAVLRVMADSGNNRTKIYFIFRMADMMVAAVSWS